MEKPSIPVLVDNGTVTVGASFHEGRLDLGIYSGGRGQAVELTEQQAVRIHELLTDALGWNDDT